jgi:hypothetical protein
MDTLLITLISLFSNLICQIHYLKSTISLHFLVTDHKICFNPLRFLFFFTCRYFNLTSLSFARR